MIELAFVVCLATNTETCRDEAMIFVDMPLNVCSLRAQAELARWAGDHPGWRIRHWKCRHVEMGKADA